MYRLPEAEATRIKIMKIHMRRQVGAAAQRRPNPAAPRRSPTA
jgi:hypothetical protein